MTYIPGQVEDEKIEEKQLSDALAALNQAELDKEALKKEIASLDNDKVLIESEIEKIKQEQGELEAKARLQQESIDERIKEVHSVLKTLQKQKDTKQLEVDKLESKIIILTGQRDELQAVIDKLDEELEDKKLLEKNVTESYKTLASACSQFRDDKLALESELADLTVQIEQQRKLFTDIEDKNKALQLTYSANLEKHKAVTEEVKAFELKVEEAKREVEQAKAEAEKIKASLEKEKQENLQLLGTVKRAEGQLEARIQWVQGLIEEGKAKKYLSENFNING